MTLYVLAVIFAVLGIVCILLPFHVAMTGLCFLALGAVCLALRLLRGKKHERTWRMILLTLTGVCMLTVFGAMMYIDREGRSNVPEGADAPEFVVVLGAQVQGDQPSLTLKKRLDLALEYLTGHPQASEPRENLEFSRTLAQAHGMRTDRVLIITSDFHLCRAKYLAKKLGMEPYGLASRTSPEVLRVNYLLREVFAFVKAAL